MTDKQIIIDGVDVSGCKHYKNLTCIADYCLTDMPFGEAKCELSPNCYYKQLQREKQNSQEARDVAIKEFNRAEELKTLLKRKEQECEELHSRTASIIYSLTGGRLSYSTYTLEGCEDAYRDQLKINVERATKELEEENDILESENFTFKELIKTQEKLINKYKQALAEIESLCKNESCSPCRELGEDYYCDECHNKIILDIINKAKEN